MSVKSLSAPAKPTARLLDTEAEIETPERVRFNYRVAGPAPRLVAYFLDFLLRLLALAVLGVLVSLAGLRAERLMQATSGIVLVAFFILDWGYFVLFETLRDGQSPGKQALGLRVVNRDGYGITFTDSVLRNLLRAVDFLPFGYAVGFVSMVGDPCFRRLGDRVAGTMVVVEYRQQVVPPVEVKPPPTAEEIAAFGLRPRLDRADLEALELFLRRRGRLGPSRERELAEMVEPIFRRRLGVPWNDPVRFLALLYHRATERDGDADRERRPGALPR